MSKRDLVAVGVLGLLLALPAMAAAGSTDPQPVVDVMEFIPEEFQASFEDRNGDGLPDFRAVPDDGIDTLWKDQMRNVPLPAVLDGLDDGLEANDGSSLTGACRGIAISYDADGTSVDAIIDTGGDGPPIDVYGQQAMTRKRPMKIDSGGTVLYAGDGDVFHDHAWFIEAAEIIRDSGGSSNDNDEFQRAGAILIGDKAPFAFTALARAEGAWVDEWGDEPLRRMGTYPLPNCTGYGWVRFVGPFPWTTIPGLIALTLLAAGLLGLLLNARPLLALAGAASAEQSRRRHPVRGALWGIVLGLGLALALMVAPIAPAAIPTVILYTVIGVVAGVAWGTFGPPRRTAGAAPPSPPPPAPGPADGPEGEPSL